MIHIMKLRQLRLTPLSVKHMNTTHYCFISTYLLSILRSIYTLCSCSIKIKRTYLRGSEKKETTSKNVICICVKKFFLCKTDRQKDIEFFRFLKAP